MRKKHATAASSLFVELRAGAEPECDGRRYRDAGGKARCAKGKHDGSCFEYSAAETQGFSCSVYARAVDELEACEACEARALEMRGGWSQKGGTRRTTARRGESAERAANVAGFGCRAVSGVAESAHAESKALGAASRRNGDERARTRARA
jgi:hypothetical protein